MKVKAVGEYSSMLAPIKVLVVAYTDSSAVLAPDIGSTVMKDCCCLGSQTTMVLSGVVRLGCFLVTSPPTLALIC